MSISKCWLCYPITWSSDDEPQHEKHEFHQNQQSLVRLIHSDDDAVQCACDINDDDDDDDDVDALVDVSVSGRLEMWNRD